jgi:hypothetical protein
MTRKTTTPAHDELAALDQAIAAARIRAEDTRRRAADALRDVPDLERRERELWGQGDEAGAEEAHAQRVELLGAADVWRTRIRGADEAVEKTQADRQGFIQARGDDLIGELVPDAVEARERLERVLGDVLDAYRDLMSLQMTLSTHSGDYRRHRRDGPALGAVAVAVDPVLNVSGIPDPMPLPRIVEEAIA